VARHADCQQAGSANDEGLTMSAVLAGAAPRGDAEPDTTAFYRNVLLTLAGDGVPFLVGGAFAFAALTGIRRDTKDLDLFIRREDYPRVETLLTQAGFRIELTFPHWLAKAHFGAAFVDLIFNTGNGVMPVDDGWFEHAIDAEILGLPVKMAPPEESICSKAFIMERERYDGADVAHLLRACAGRLDWQRLRRLFGPHWRVLLSHLVLFGYVYPGERTRVPTALMEELLELLRQEMREPPSPLPLCAGTLLSREQYLPDIEEQGLIDARCTEMSKMTTQDVDHWTRAIPGRQGTGNVEQPLGEEAPGSAPCNTEGVAAARSPVMDNDRKPRQPDAEAPAGTPASAEQPASKPARTRGPRRAKADRVHDEGPLESLGRAVSAPVRQTADPTEDEKPR
jgi:hypothetical protein